MNMQKRNCEGLMENFGDVAHSFSAEIEEEELVCSFSCFLCVREFSGGQVNCVCRIFSVH